ncbi:UvrD-helicase domain-containing protein [Actinokineospora iranica]|uniref:Part of AAA domain-containing protein n=1 Tax=Actinokineospora iranica TaxID=1271860 RepID=A0A1G6JDS7_9PSEU|nr:UvrD-helicase domain-containing protein [Actinokineospora iranica]SDC16797.1 Part of AAA domain-containing protein [Actinokineospora iranica]
MGHSAHERQAEKLVRQALPGLPPAHRRVLAALVARTADGWHVFARPGQGEGRADAFVVGPGGVLAVVVSAGCPTESAARAILRRAERRFAGIRDQGGHLLVRSAISLVVVRPGDGAPAPDQHLCRVVNEERLPELVPQDGPHLPRGLVDDIADQAENKLPDYIRLSLRRLRRVCPSEAGDQVGCSVGGAADTWLAFLHPNQDGIVSRHYSGPARISGPAGTGKTVVALHRLRHLARRSVGPLLFTTVVRTLPQVHRTSFRRLAPELADRVEFTNLHAWVRDFLRSRGHDLVVQHQRVAVAFCRAWQAHRGELADLEPNPDYWRAEIDRVIKGRGIATLADYARAGRRGRSLRLDAERREHVWRLFQCYQGNLAEDGLHDHNDLIDRAMGELARDPLEESYAAVVADEVQDMPLVGLRLLRELAGDGANRLLLLGDGQQQVYPGGWRLSDAGIPISGRGEVLRVNYRNRANVLGFAQHLHATNEVDDSEGAVIALRDAESANAGGRTECWRGREDALPAALTAAVKSLPVPEGDAAVIVFEHRDLDRCRDILGAAGIGFQLLADYTGEADDRLKLGTVHDAKGLDFRAVLVVETTARGGSGLGAEREFRELRDRQHLVAATRARDYLWWGMASTRPWPLPVPDDL